MSTLDLLLQTEARCAERLAAADAQVAAWLAAADAAEALAAAEAEAGVEGELAAADRALQAALVDRLEALRTDAGREVARWDGITADEVAALAAVWLARLSQETP